MRAKYIAVDVGYCKKTCLRDKIGFFTTGRISGKI